MFLTIMPPYRKLRTHSSSQTGVSNYLPSTLFRVKQLCPNKTVVYGEDIVRNAARILLHLAGKDKESSHSTPVTDLTWIHWESCVLSYGNRSSRLYVEFENRSMIVRSHLFKRISLYFLGTLRWVLMLLATESLLIVNLGVVFFQGLLK